MPTSPSSGYSRYRLGCPGCEAPWVGGPQKSNQKSLGYSRSSLVIGSLFSVSAKSLSGPTTKNNDLASRCCCSHSFLTNTGHIESSAVFVRSDSRLGSPRKRKIAWENWRPCSGSLPSRMSFAIALPLSVNVSIDLGGEKVPSSA